MNAWSENQCPEQHIVHLSPKLDVQKCDAKMNGHSCQIIGGGGGGGVGWSLCICLCTCLSVHVLMLDLSYVILYNQVFKRPTPQFLDSLVSLVTSGFLKDTQVSILDMPF